MSLYWISTLVDYLLTTPKALCEISAQIHEGQIRNAKRNAASLLLVELSMLETTTHRARPCSTNEKSGKQPMD